MDKDTKTIVTILDYLNLPGVAPKLNLNTGMEYQEWVDACFLLMEIAKGNKTIELVEAKKEK